MLLGRLIFAVFIFFATVGLSAVDAVAAPQQLQNKTITLTWTAQAMVRDPDGKEHPSTSNIRYVVYVSSLGRLFEHSSRSAGKSTQAGDIDINAAKTKMGEARGLRFEGSSLVANRGYAGGGGAGAMRAVASFDPSFSSCTLAVTHGKEGGKLKRQGTDGVVREILSISVVSPSCSIQNGNTLAN